MKLLSIIKSLAAAVALLTTAAANAMKPQTQDSTVWLWGWETRADYAVNSNSVLMQRMLPGSKTSNFGGSVHLRAGFRNIAQERFSSVSQGAGLGVYTFGQRKAIGTPVALYLYQCAPITNLSSKLSLEYEWNFGASFGWHPTSSGYSVVSNLVSGSKVNAYINLGFLLSYQVSPGFELIGGVDLTHFSNGNTSWPNPGINLLGGRLGMRFTPGASTLTIRHSPFSRAICFRNRFGLDLVGYGAWRKAYVPYSEGAFTEEGEAALQPGHFGVAGMNISPMWKVHPVIRIGASADAQWSGKYALRLNKNPERGYRYIRPGLCRQIAVGLSARAELVMPIFAINVGIGYGMAGPKESRKLYQVANLKVNLWRGMFLNIGYRFTEFRSPSNLMLGMGYTLFN